MEERGKGNNNEGLGWTFMVPNVEISLFIKEAKKSIDVFITIPMLTFFAGFSRLHEIKI